MKSDYNRAARALCALVVACMMLFPVRAHAQAAPPAPPAAADGSQLRIFLMTIEAGTQIWEKFGHDALWVVDSQTGRELSYNYGIFDDKAPGFLRHFLQGLMLYSMNTSGPIPPSWEVEAYRQQNRTVWLQELNLTPAQKAELRDFLAWNNRPENMIYRYDYFRDNCTTRIRDALDRVLKGQLRAVLEPQPAGTTYRWQARRLLSVNAPAYAGIELAMGHPVDRPLNRWEDSFLPGELRDHLDSVQVRAADGSMAPLVLSRTVAFQSTRTPEPVTPPNETVTYLALSFLVAVAFILLARIAARRRSKIARILFGFTGFVWYVLVGFFGVVAMLLWFATDHTVTSHNENLLQANLFSLVLAVVIIAVAAGRGERLAFRVAGIVTALSVIGFVLQILPGLDQFNGEVIALLLPAHLGMLAALRDFVRTDASPREDISAIHEALRAA